MPELTPEQIAAAAAEASKPKGFTGEFTLADGSVLKAANYEEAVQLVDKRRVDAVEAMRTREAENAELRAELEKFKKPVPSDPQSEYSDKKFWETANVDTKAAVRMALAADLGVKPEDLPRMFTEMRNVTVQSADQMEINTFMRNNPDFPGTPEVSGILMDTLAKENRPLNSENLEYVYLRAVRDGQIEPLAEAATQQWVPPSVSGGATTGAAAVTMSQLNALTDEQYEDFMRKTGLLKDGGKQEGIRI